MDMLILDFDGVIGTEQKFMGAEGREFLAVSSRDTQALKRIIANGVEVLIVTASSSRLIHGFAEKYGCKILSGENKLGRVRYYWDSGQLSNAICIGDDVGDIPLMRACGSAYCPADAHARVKRAFPVLQSKGGQGVIQEVEEIIEQKRSSHDKVYRASIAG